jgi:hypothetical protein
LVNFTKRARAMIPPRRQAIILISLPFAPYFLG